MIDWITLGTGVVGITAWAVRLEGRINTQNEVTRTVHEAIKENLAGEFQKLDARLGRIESAIIRKAYERERDQPHTSAGSGGR